MANDEYEHEGLGQLSAPSADAQALAGVLGDEQIGDFDVQIVRNEPAHIIQALIEELFSEARPDDVLLVHFSCHGLKSESGELFFAAANTRPNRLGSTAVSADFVQRCLRTSRSRSVVLLLDCCYGGAFARGVTVRAAGDVDVLGSFPPERAGSGRGRAVITASSAMEYAFEGDRLSDDAGPQPSVFTSALVEGLASGDADRNQDGWVSLDELYDYVFDKVRERNPNQTPSRDVEMQGDLFIARRSHPVTRPAPLSPELRQAIDSPLAGVRGGAVEELARVLRAGHAGLVLAARIALEDLTEDDSRHVSAAAEAALRQAPAQAAPAAAPEPAAVAPPATQPATTAERAIPERAIPESAATEPASAESTTPEPAALEPAALEAATVEPAPAAPPRPELSAAGSAAPESAAVALVAPELAAAAVAGPEAAGAAPATQELAAARSAAAETTPAPAVTPAPVTPAPVTAAPAADAAGPVTAVPAALAGAR
ncbi:MAG TPA: caspase family protein, partial [Streptosporangiaceae bacterium]